MPYFSSVERVGGTSEEADLVYYNADIINNNTSDFATGQPPGNDPQIRFSETRDTSIIRDASKYEFSIVRFQMNGAGLDLPLFIPNIKLGQADPNRTEYSLAISYIQSWSFTDGSTYTFNIEPAETDVIFVPETNSTLLAPLPPAPLTTQDLSTRYYWVYTYQWWVDLVNRAIINEANPNDLTPGQTSAMAKLFLAFKARWELYTFNRNITVANPFPYADVSAFMLAVFKAPRLNYNPESKLFNVVGDVRAFGTYAGTPFVPPAPPYVVAQPISVAQGFLYFNSNLYGLFSSFPAVIYNYGLQQVVLDGYYAELIFPNKNYKNLLDLTTAQPIPVPVIAQGVYWIAEQDYRSTSQLWSPIASLVFTSTLLPIKAESTGEPIRFGTGNLGANTATTQSAFQPIITDIGIDLSNDGAEGYRQFIYYVPTAEYRMACFEKSRQEIRQIDIQVWWKNRLDNQLYPVQMYNLSSVSVKVLFRKRPADMVGSI
jgi:hypothetical protein